MARLRSPVPVFGLILLGLLATGILYCGRENGLDHAFTDIDRGLSDARKQIERINAERLKDIRMEAEAYRNPQNERYAGYAVRLEALAKEYASFIDSIKALLLEANTAANGGQARKNGYFYPAPGKILVSGEPNQVSVATHLAQKTQTLCMAIDSLTVRVPVVRASIPLQFEYFGNGRFQIGRDQSSFLELPLSGILAVLSDLQNRAAVSALMGLNYIWHKTGAWGELCPDYFSPMVSAQAGYVSSGFPYKADIFLAPYSPNFLSWEVKIDGKPIPVKDGVAKFENVATGGSGHKFFRVESVIRYLNRTSSGTHVDTFRVSKKFSYEVGCEPPKVIQPPAAQFLYAGVDNPVTLRPLCGYAPNEIKIKSTNAMTHTTGPGRYTIQPQRPGKVALSIYLGLGLPPSIYEFTARPLPDPQPCLGDSLRDGRITPERLVRQTALNARYPEDFDFRVDCPVVSFQLTRIRPRADSEAAQNEGSDFNAEVRRLLETALPGDRLLFHDIAVRVPGEKAERTVGAMAFRVE